MVNLRAQKHWFLEGAEILRLLHPSHYDGSVDDGEALARRSSRPRRQTLHGGVAALRLNTSMGKASSRKSSRRRRRSELGIDQIDAPRRFKRALIRDLDAAPSIAEIRNELAEFDRRSTILACAASANEVPPVLL